MNVKIIGIILSIIMMVFSPTVSGMLFDNYRESVSDELDKSELQSRHISLYVVETGQVETIDFEEYICGVVMAEVPSSFDEEALKAMAVAVRSYCLRRLENCKKDVLHCSADVCNDHTHCLGYISYVDAVGKWGELAAEDGYRKIKKAVKDTAGEVLYYNGTVADAVFHSSSSEKTESAKNVWGFDVPYLVSADSVEESQALYSQFDSDEFSKKLEEYGIECVLSQEPSNWISSYKKNESGRCESVVIGGTEISGRRIREIFNLKSTCFEIEYLDGFFTFAVKGNGHGVGMSQYGCEAMSKNGYDYREILAHYYCGTYIGLY